MFGPELINWGLDPFQGVRGLRREMGRLFDQYLDAEPYPPVNIWASGDEAVVKAELPGVDPKDVEITVKDSVVSLSGERKAEEPAEGVVCHRCERGSGSFSRSFSLPFAVDREKVKASFANGVLTITLPRAEESKPRKIAITAE